MDHYLEELLEIFPGISDIFFISRDHLETKNRDQTNKCKKNFICIIDGQYFKLEFMAVYSLVYVTPVFTAVFQKEEISELEYVQLSEGKIRLDTPTEVELCRKRIVVRKQMFLIEKNPPKCLNCNRELRIRKLYNKYHWMCNLAVCVASREITTDYGRLMEELNSLH